MSGPVKSYNSPLRELQAKRTRERILQAARETFRDKGYGATTLADIAGAAGVAESTVRAVFKTKPNLVEHLLRLAVRGSDDEMQLQQREAFQRVLAWPRPTRCSTASPSSPRPSTAVPGTCSRSSAEPPAATPRSRNYTSNGFAPDTQTNERSPTASTNSARWPTTRVWMLRQTCSGSTPRPTSIGCWSSSGTGQHSAYRSLVPLSVAATLG